MKNELAGRRAARSRLARRAPAGVIAAIAAAATTALLAGCVSMPSGGPVLSYPVTQGTGAQGQPFMQIVTGPPGAGWSPPEIVQGFLSASASIGDNDAVARQYLTPTERKTWYPAWSAIVYDTGPSVTTWAFVPGSQKQKATVTIGGTVLASLSGHGSYAVPSASAPDGPQSGKATFQLVKTANQWRISSAPAQLLLTSDSFQNDYQSHNLYFFDAQTGRYLVPDPVYVPLQATPASLMNGLVYDLVHQPDDWLSGGATQTAFPAGTKLLGDVTLDGVTAVVNLGGAIAKEVGNADVMQRVSAQLLWTLSSSGQGSQPVQSVQVEVNGKPWIPGGGQGNPVQAKSSSSYQPPSGSSKEFYFLDKAGNLLSRDGRPQGKAATVARVGTGFRQLAVSPSGNYLAALRADGTLYTGRLGGKLAKQDGGGYTTISWGGDDRLWTAAGGQLYVLRDGAGPQSAALVDADGISDFSGPVTMIRVAPDGVRMAILIGTSTLKFGAIAAPREPRPGQAGLRRVTLSPFYVSKTGATFTSLTWYGPDDVIVLASQGPAVTEYPVNGGTAKVVPAEPQMQAITASPGNALVASLPGGHLIAMAANASLTGSWSPINDGSAPAYPG